MRSPRPELPLDHSIPAPLGIVGMFILWIAVLVALLGVLPQQPLDRAVTFGAAIVLWLIGWLMRRHATRPAPSL